VRDTQPGVPDLKLVVGDEHIHALQRANIDYVDLTSEGEGTAPADGGNLDERHPRPEESVVRTPIIPAVPIRVIDLPLPSDLAEQLASRLRSSGYTRSERRAAEEDFKLDHHYAGHYILATSGPRGLEIHGIDLEGPEQLNEHVERLTAQGYKNILSLFPRAWDDPNDAIVTLNPV